MCLGRTKAGAAAHFPQATSEGNAPPGPPSPAKPLLPDTNTDTNHQQANREKGTLQSKAVGHCRGLTVLTSGSIIQPKVRHLPLLASSFAFQFVLQGA